MSENVGFIGLGAMGAPMAANLIAARIIPTVWNRTAAKAEPLIAKGAKLASAPGDAASPGGVVITMLADDAALESVVTGERGIASRLGAGGIHISMSTIAPATARTFAKYHADRGSTYVAAPFGDEPGAANVVKLCGNFLIASALEAMAEAQAMAKKNGIEPAQLAEMLGKTLFACPVYQRYGEAIAARRHTPAGFKVPLGLKDVELVLKTAGEVRSPMPLAGLVRERLVSALAKGRDEMDWSALALGVLDDAGIE